MARVIIDTSSILYGISFRKDIFAIAAMRFPGSTMIISKGVLRELSGISKGNGRRGADAMAALALIRVKNVKVDTDSGTADSWALRSARHNNFIVITNDTALLRRIKQINPNVFKLSKSGAIRR